MGEGNEAMTEFLYRWWCFKSRQDRRKLLEGMVRHCTRKGNYQAAKLFLDDLQQLRDKQYQEAQQEFASGVRWIGKGRK